MSNDSPFLDNQASIPETILSEMDFGCHPEAIESPWESAWIDIGGEG
jgi:hypothetical protein